MYKAIGAAIGTVLAATLLSLVSPAAANAADASSEANFVAQINNTRAQHGVAPLAVYNELTGVARGWSDQMAANGGISHNPNLASQVTANWTKLGENVGVGNSVDQLMAAFIASPAHYQNIVDPSFNYIGVGVSYGADGRMYVTQDFMAMADSTPPPPPPPPPAPPTTEAPAPTPPPAPAPTTTAAPAPATTTTTAPAPAPAPAPAAPVPTVEPLRVKAVLTALRSVDA